MAKTKKKKKNELKPEILERDLKPQQKQELLQIAHNIEQSTVVHKQEDTSSDSFFKAVVKEMNSSKNISTKTEYLSVQENFAGTRLQFLSEYAFMPFLSNFVTTFEKKRVSLHRKGRQELVMMLKERQQELKTDNMQNFAKMFGVNE